MENLFAQFSVFGLLGMIILLTGLFLVMSGAGILKVEKVSVVPGQRTWILGILCTVVGVYFLYWDTKISGGPVIPDPELTPAISASQIPPTSQLTSTPEVKLDVFKESTNNCSVVFNGFYMDNTSSDPLLWEWGDGNFTRGDFPQEHTYSKSGTYSVTVTTPAGVAKTFIIDLTCQPAGEVPIVQPPTSPANDVETPPRVYVWLEWPEGNNYNYDMDLQIESDIPESRIIFWAHQFGFQNGPGGYIGLQTVEGETKAIFSIWDALSGSDGCDTFSGEGTGIRCFRDFAWKVGELYRLRIWAEPSSHTWQGAIYNYSTDEEVVIGRIAVPEDRGLLSLSSVVWTEYVGFDTCRASFSDAIWSNPVVRNGAGESNPLKATVAYGDGNCELSNVSYLGDYHFRLEAGLEVKRTIQEGTVLWP